MDPENSRIRFPNHPVWKEIKQRKKGESNLNLLLYVQGSGPGAGCIPAFMLASLERAGIKAELFDSITGESSGPFSSTYYIAGRVNTGVTIYYENQKDFFRLRKTGLPQMNLDLLVNQVMTHDKPLDFEKVVAARQLRPISTSLQRRKRHVFEPAESIE